MFTGVLQEGRDGPPRLHKRGWWFFESPSKAALWPGVNREGSLLLGGRPKTDRYEVNQTKEYLCKRKE